MPEMRPDEFRFTHHESRFTHHGSPIKQLLSQFQFKFIHLAAVSFVIVSTQMKHTVKDKLVYLAVK